MKSALQTHPGSVSSIKVFKLTSGPISHYSLLWNSITLFNFKIYPERSFLLLPDTEGPDYDCYCHGGSRSRLTFTCNVSNLILNFCRVSDGGCLILFSAKTQNISWNLSKINNLQTMIPRLTPVDYFLNTKLNQKNVKKEGSDAGRFSRKTTKSTWRMKGILIEI